MPVPEEARLAMVGPSHFSPSYLSGDFPNISSFGDFTQMCLGTFASVNNCSQLYPIIACVPVKVKVKVSAKISQKSPVCFAFGKAQFFVASFISSASAGVLLHLWLLPAPLPHRLPLLHHDPQASHSGDDSGL